MQLAISKCQVACSDLCAIVKATVTVLGDEILKCMRPAQTSGQNSFCSGMSSQKEPRLYTVQAK